MPEIPVQKDREIQNSPAGIIADLERIDLKIHAKLIEKRQNDDSPDRFAGLYISEKQVDAIINAPAPHQRKEQSGPTMPNPGGPARPGTQLINKLTAEGDQSPGHKLASHLIDLARMFGLTRFETDVLLVCLLPELDLNYQWLYGYLQDDITLKSPTVNLALQLLCESFEENLKVREAFSPSAPLVKFNLVALHEDYRTKTTPLLAKILQIEERLMDYLLGNNRLDVRLLPFSELVFPKTRLGDIILNHDIQDRLGKLMSQFNGNNPVCHFQGSDGVGKHTTAEAICSALGMPMLDVQLGKFTAMDTPRDSSLCLILRESMLQQAAVYFDEFDLLRSDEKGNRVLFNLFLKVIKDHPGWIFTAGEKEWLPGDVLGDKPFLSIEMPLPSYNDRKLIWERLSMRNPSTFAGIDFSEPAAKFRLSGGQIRDASSMAWNLAFWRDPESITVTTQDIFAACRKQFRGTLGSFARKIATKYRWDDIILPEDQTQQLREICGHIKHHHKVYGDWGFELKISTGKGLNVLFAGPSGTGKTMAAEIMANELGLDLYKIDLSAIVSKYIGETEKNLDRIFKEGQISNAILFFDEADALFGKRSEVRDSHDRYANIEMAYLLQKMDEYEGMVILATNLRKNMDEAFARRMHYAIEFPIPEEPDRYRIWQTIFPPQAPLAPDIDRSFLARQFKITGGNIKNIAVCAAFLAAQNGGVINMESIIRGTKREYQKLGKLCTESDFDRYFDLVKQ